MPDTIAKPGDTHMNDTAEKPGPHGAFRDEAG